VRLLLPLVCLLAAHACSAAPAPSRGCRPGDADAATGIRLEVDGRTVLLDAPAAPADRPLPLIVAFHGFRSDPAELRAGTKLGELALREQVIVAYPAGRDDVELLGTRGRGWDLRPDQTTDRDFVRTLLDRLEADRCIDRHRVYATGFSNGGFVTSLLGCQLADRFAAIAPVAGALDLGACTPADPVPILFLYGSSDQVVTPDRIRTGVDWWVAHNRCGTADVTDGCTRWKDCAAAVAACEGTQAHRWPPDATERIWRFFGQHAKDRLTASRAS
jgi:poly(3-hydroxybutyrate) depolymerase